MEGSVSDIELVYVDALVSSEEGTLIYSGVLVDYELNRDSGLDQITLKQVQRRFLKHDGFRGSSADKMDKKFVDNESEINPPENGKITPYIIPGHVLVIKYSSVININFSYYRMESSEEGLEIKLVE